ncbi:amino acid adenylation domain-containing protein [Streptomyces sp. NBC_00481]|uniref:non-ribosomal peptide synthetase n=1 Tax=Streptomyces sp. NBC_00481 TaxID=2975755 RepID=UPI002DDA1F51|nr:non-ribosomal peptide synthetase [Streptomyces sp. NBC_00481]WRZ01108.1 amino acid adenylation domain-containing protein [Streptomyces sp. NBC_00481]
MHARTNEQTVLAAIRSACDRDPGAVAAVFPAQPALGRPDETRFTRAGLDRAARALAVGLRRHGDAPVLLLMQPGPDYLTAFLATTYAGLPAAPVYPPNPADVRRDFTRLGAILAKLPDATLLTEPGLLQPLRALFAERLPHIDPARLLDTAADDALADAWREPAVRAEDPLFIQFTSGSTGTPRGVVVAHRNLLANVAAITGRFGLGPTSTGALWLPPYHDMGLVGGILTPLLTGFPVHLLSPLSFLADPMSWLRLLDRTRATHTGAPNFGYALATRRATRQDIAALDLSALEVAFCGAEPVDPATLRAFAHTFAPAGLRPDVFLPCYGLAEATLIVSGARAGAGPRTVRADTDALAQGRVQEPREGAAVTELVTSGPPVAGTDVLIADPLDGSRRPAGTVGEILVASDGVATGYHDEPEESARVFGVRVAGSSRTWIRTGDLGFLTDDGELVPVARVKDVIVVRGRNIHPQDLERTAQDTDPAIRKGCVAVSALPGPDGSEEILLVAELRKEAAGDPAAARRTAAAVRAALAREHSVPVAAVHLIRPATLPKTSSGKVRRRAARAAHLDGSLDTLWCDTASPPPPALASSPQPGAVSLPPPGVVSPPQPGAVSSLSPGVVSPPQPGAVSSPPPGDASPPPPGAPSPHPPGTGPRPAGNPAAPHTTDGDLLHALAATVIAHFGGGDAPAGGPGGDAPAWAPDSLTAARLAGETSRIFRILLPPADVLAGVDAGRLAELIRSAPTAGAPLAAPDGPAPLTPGQESLALLHELDPAAPGLSLGIAFALPQAIPPEHVARALNTLVARHPALRSRLVRRGQEWTRVIDAAPDPAATWGRYCTLTRLLATGEDELLGLLDEHCRRVPDLTEGPLFHAEMVLCGTYGAHLAVTVHHAVADLWSIGVLATELAALLTEVDPATAAAALPAPPATPAARPDPRRTARAWRFWRELWGHGVDPLQLPPAQARPEKDTEEGKGLARTAVHAPLTLDAARTRALKALAKECGATLYAVLLAAQSLTLARLTNTARVPVGVPMHGRTSGTHHAVGFLVSTVPVPLDTATGTVGDLVARASHALRGALAHHTVGHPELVALSAADNGPDIPAPDAALLLQQDTPGAPRGLGTGLLGAGVRLGDLHLGVTVTPPSIGPFGLTTLLTENDGTLTGRVEADPARYADWLAGQFATAFTAVVDGLSAGADRAVDDISAVDDEQRARMARWSRPALPENGESTLHELVLDTARRHPGRTAVVAHDGSLSYRELADRSARVAAALAAAGCGPGSTVGVLAPRGRDLPAALLGVLRAGAAYLPLDPATPPDRVAAVLQDAGCRHVLTASAAVERDHLLPVTLVDLDAALRDAHRTHIPVPETATGPDDPAYLLFTSGSTGRPKGVVIRHRGAVNLVRWAGRAYRDDELARTLAVTPTTFDLSVFELFVPLARGCQVHILDSVLDLSDAPAHARGATLLNTVPSAVTTLAERGTLPASLRTVNVAGEPLTADLVRTLHDTLPGVRVVNLYGPSETTTYSTYAELPPGTTDPVPIGRPVGGTTLAVVDADLRPVPPGGTGELLIGGAGVARGYAGRADLTAARFLPDPDSPGRTRYRTGDLVRWRPDGQLEFIGRTDHQVKVRGFRIELGDVEKALRTVAPLKDTAVLALGEGTGRRLAAYLVPEQPPDGDPAPWLRGIRRRLGRELPGYMVPGQYAVLEELPRNRHGKLDRHRLAHIPASALRTGSRIAPRDEPERRVAACWRQVLPTTEVAVSDEFLDLGGHSLMLSRLAHLLGRAFDVHVPLTELRTRTTVAEQAAYLSELARQPAPPTPATPGSPRRLDRSRYTAAGRSRGTP